MVAKALKTPEANVVVFGFSTAFGGGRSTGFGLAYKDVETLKKIEPKHRLVRLGLATKKTRTRKQWKDSKRKMKRTWGESHERRRSARRRLGAAPPPGSSPALPPHPRTPSLTHTQCTALNACRYRQEGSRARGKEGCRVLSSNHALGGLQHFFLFLQYSALLVGGWGYFISGGCTALPPPLASTAGAFYSRCGTSSVWWC